MFRLNSKYIFVSLCFALASCQSVPPAEPIETKAPIIKAEVKPEPMVDKGLKVINVAIEQVKNNQLELAETILKAYLINQDDDRAKLNLALIYLKTERSKIAKKLLTSIPITDKNSSIVFEHLAIIARQNGQFTEAKQLYLKALKNSNKPSIHLNFAILLDLYLNELDTALEHYKAYQAAGLAEQDGIELKKWMADLNLRIKRKKQ